MLAAALRTTLRKVLHILILLSVSNGMMDVTHSNKVEREIEKYLAKLETCDFSREGGCIMIRGSNISGEIGSTFMKSNEYCSSLIVSEGTVTGDEKFKFKIHNFFVFVPTIAELIAHTDKLLENSLWNSRTRTYFIVTSEVVDTKVLTSTLSKIWSKKVINFVVVTVTAKYQVYTYNAYKRKSLNHIPKSKLFCDSHFPDKMKNLYGKPFRASINNQIPYTVKENGEFTGDEIQIYKLFVYTLKASEQIIERPSVNDSIETLLQGEVEIFLLRILNVYYYINVDYSYPYDMVHKIIMVPKPSKIPPYMNMFCIFDSSIWIWLLIVINILPMIFITSDNHHTMGKFSDYYLTLWSILLNVSTSSKMFQTKMKWLLYIWVWCGLILGAAFQSSLLGSYLKPNHEKGIKTLDDLRASNLKLNLHPFFAASKDLSEILRARSKYVRMELVDARVLIEARDINTAFFVTKEFAEFLMNRLKKINGDPTYEILKGNLVSGVLVFHLQKHSPFLEKFDKSVLIFKQHGLIRNYKYPNAKVDTEKVVLNLSHFLIVFCLLGKGLFIGLLVFFGEILWHARKCSYKTHPYQSS